jgi:hypothetical protein
MFQSKKTENLTTLRLSKMKALHLLNMEAKNWWEINWQKWKRNKIWSRAPKDLGRKENPLKAEKKRAV